MILPSSLLAKPLLLISWSFAWTGFALTEAFLGQAFLSLFIALIGATPPTVAIILLSRRQSAEREAMNKRQIAEIAETKKEVLANQGQIKEALDGKLTTLIRAETALAKAEGVQQERVEERARVAETIVPAAQPAVPSQIEIVQPEGNPVPTIPGKKKPE